jgi:phosphomannomutase
LFRFSFEYNVSMIDKSIFKAYDIRGVYPTELDEEGAYKIARAIVEYVHPKTVAVGRDARLTAPAIARAVCLGLEDGGCEVTDCGMAATDMIGFAAGKFPFDVTISVSASHNPKEWIGMKLFARGGESIGGEGEIQEIGNIVADLNVQYPMSNAQSRGWKKFDLLPDWIEHVLSFAKLDGLPHLKIVVDAGNGVAGPIVRELFKHLPVTLVEMYFEPDGNFPNHLPSPIEPKNVEDLCKRVVAEKADLGMAFDGDADRLFLVDDAGRWVNGSEMTALVMDGILNQDPTRTVLYNAICGWNVRDVVERHQAHALRTKVGHGFIKKDMRTYDAYFAGEHSGHYFFKDNYGCDSGLIAAMFVLSLMAREGKPLGTLLEPHRKYFQIPETNFEVTDTGGVIDKLAEKFAHEEIDWLDGLTVRTLEWWANIRPSQTQPLLRLNIEAKTPELLHQVETELTEAIQQLDREQPSHQ